MFEPSRTAMASLVDAVAEADFALFVFAPDDVTKLRNDKLNTVRDNVVFELGLFMGALGAERCFMVQPRSGQDLHLPTDLAGLTPAVYEADRQDGNLVAALGPACNRVRRAAEKLGRRKTASGATELLDSPIGDLTGDPDDCISLIQSWMGQRSSSLNTAALRYSDVDRELKLVPGSAKIHIEQAARRWDYVPERKGETTILFKDRD